VGDAEVIGAKTIKIISASWNFELGHWRDVCYQTRKTNQLIQYYFSELDIVMKRQNI
jgi:hypothetical protein